MNRDDEYFIIDAEGPRIGSLPSDLELITCVPKSALPRPAAGSVEGNCHDCQTPVWVAPASLKARLQRPHARFVCIDCSVLRLKSQRDAPSKI